MLFVVEDRLPKRIDVIFCWWFVYVDLIVSYFVVEFARVVLEGIVMVVLIFPSYKSTKTIVQRHESLFKCFKSSDSALLITDVVFVFHRIIVSLDFRGRVRAGHLIDLAYVGADFIYAKVDVVLPVLFSFLVAIALFYDALLLKVRILD